MFKIDVDNFIASTHSPQYLDCISLKMGISLVKMKFIAEFLSYPVVLLVVLNLEVVDALEVL